MATMNNPTATPEWLEKAARTEAPATTDRVPLVQPTRTPTPPIDLRPASRLPAEVSVEAKKTTDETDVHRRGYDAAALLPSTVILGLVTVAVVMFIRPFVAERYVAGVYDAAAPGSMGGTDRPRRLSTLQVSLSAHVPEAVSRARPALSER